MSSDPSGIVIADVQAVLADEGVQQAIGRMSVSHPPAFGDPGSSGTSSASRSASSGARTGCPLRLAGYLLHTRRFTGPGTTH